ncbi:MAG TPA: polysaccharide deacetylase family protein [Chitinispirillaceae bacterium]|nr:polysaccharide deacetylase family protein [Chitinispirillaceae bacterium]
MTNKPFATVVIPAYNEEISIGECLKSLKNQDYTGQYEIVVIDNASSDATSSIAKRFSSKVIYEEKRGYNFAIKRGFDEAEGEIIACTDADSIVPRNWLSKLVKHFEDPDVVGCGGVFRFADGPLWLKLVGEFGRCNYHIAGANMAVRRSAYQQIGGFSPDVNQGADVDLDRRLRKIGTVIIDRKIVTATSSRRFQAAFWETIFRYYVNDFFLLTTGKPLFHSFKDYRLDSFSSVKKSLAMPSIMTLLFVLFFGWIIQKPTSQLLGTSMFEKNSVKSVALTFDDGPGIGTDTILQILKRYNAHATFFLIGKNAETYPDIVRRIDQNGHEIGNHTFSHSLESSVEMPSKLAKELIGTDNTIDKIIHKHTYLFRPPHGWRNPWMVHTCNELDMSIILWNIDSKDWADASQQTILHTVLDDVKPGSIILFHDRLSTKRDRLMGNTINALPALLDSLVNRGYHFVTISELKSEDDWLTFKSPAKNNLDY